MLSLRAVELPATGATKKAYRGARDTNADRILNIAAPLLEDPRHPSSGNVSATDIAPRFFLAPLL